MIYNELAQTLLVVITTVSNLDIVGFKLD